MDHEKEFIQHWCPDVDEDDFFIKVRLRSRWDEEHFLRMERIAYQLLDDMQHNPQLRERWHYTFTDLITMTRHLLSHPGFLAENDLSMTKEQYKEYIGHRIERFEALRKRYEALT